MTKTKLPPITIDKELKEKAKAKAKGEGRSLSGWVRWLISRECK